MNGDGQQQVSELTLATQASIAGELGMIRLLLETVLGAERSDVLQILVGNFENRQEAVLLDSPGTRAKRLLIPRSGQGTDLFSLTTTAVPVLPVNEGRIGGVARCRDATNAAVLYLCTVGDLQQRAARPAIFLPVNGASPWDFRIGNSIYGGPLCAVAAAATSSISVAEF